MKPDYTDQDVVAIYHQNCKDGTTAAAIFLQAIPHIALFPLSHGYTKDDLATIIEHLTPDTTLYIVDFSLSHDDLVAVAEHAKEVIILDHHISAKEDLEKAAMESKKITYTFDNNRSGASLAWLHLHPDESLPELVQLVEYSDTGNWHKDERTKYTNAYITPKVNQPEAMVPALSLPFEDIITKAEEMDELIRYLIDSYVEKTEPITLTMGEHTVIGYNMGLSTQILKSSIGSILARKHNQTVAIFRITGDNVRIAFRGIDEAEPSAQDLAELHGGGGHRNAAGASMPLKDFVNMIQI